MAPYSATALVFFSDPMEVDLGGDCLYLPQLLILLRWVLLLWRWRLRVLESSGGSGLGGLFVLSNRGELLPIEAYLELVSWFK